MFFNVGDHKDKADAFFEKQFLRSEDKIKRFKMKKICFRICLLILKRGDQVYLKKT